HGRVPHTVQPQQARALVELVLHLRALGDLDDRAEVMLDVVAQLDVVPRVHSTADDTLPTRRAGLRRGATSDGGVGAISGPPSPATLIEARHGSAGARRAMGGLGAISGPP